MFPKDPTPLPDRMPAYDSMYVAQWEPKKDIPYRVEVYLQNSNNDSYSLSDVLRYTGATGSYAAPSPPAYEGFTAPASLPGDWVKADGSTVLKYYYTRNAYKLTFDPGHGLKPTTASYKFGAPIAAPIVNQPGYLFDYWSLRIDNPAAEVVPSTMPAHELYYVAQYKLDPHVPYTVEYYMGDRSGSNFQLMKTGTRYGTAFAALDIRDFNGQDLGTEWMYPFAKLAASTPSTFHVDPTQNSRVKLYFVPYVQSASYRVVHYLQNLDDDGFTQADAIIEGGAVGSTVTATPTEVAGFTFDSSNPDNVTSGTVTDDGQLTLKLYYTRNSYSLSFMDTLTETNYSTTQVKYGAPIVPPAEALPTDFYPPGFELITWDPMEEDTPSLDFPDATMPAHDASYNARFGPEPGQIGFP